MPSTTKKPPDVRTSNKRNEEVLPAIPRGKSIAYHHLMSNNAVFVSLDIETRGEYCGIIQLSAEMFLVMYDNSRSEKCQPTVVRLWDTFNEYVNPGANALWDDAATLVHGLHTTLPEIVEADDIGLVWCCFTEWIVDNFCADDEGILVAYDGETCDLKWLWKITQASWLDVHHAMRRFVKNAGILGMMCIINKFKKTTTYLLTVQIMF